MNAILRLILTALPCEAKPLIAHYGLKRRMSEDAFTIYEKNGIALAVTGVGKAAMAAATAYAFMLFGKPDRAVWLNVGMAGHQDHALGEIFMAHKITDGDTGQRWYPPIAFRALWASEHLYTVSRPCHDYEQDFLYDMEASAFYATAARFSTAELIQCLKIVSDNRRSPARNIHAAQVSQWVEAKLPVIDGVLESLQALAQSLPRQDGALSRQYLERWHFTRQEQIQLKRLLARWQALMPDDPPPAGALKEFSQGKEVLDWLKHRLETLKFKLNP